MCLTIKGKYEKTKSDKPLPRVAGRDKIVYKVLRRYGDDLISFHQMYTYRLGKVYSSSLGVEKAFSVWAGWKVEKGLHAYINRVTAENDLYNASIVLIKCRIPKGAKYYLGMNGDIVSNRIILEKIM